MITTGAGCSAGQGVPKPHSALHTRLLPAAETARVVVQGGGAFWVRVLAADARPLILNEESPALQLFFADRALPGCASSSPCSFRPASGLIAAQLQRALPAGVQAPPQSACGRCYVEKTPDAAEASQLAGGGEHPVQGIADQGHE